METNKFKRPINQRTILYRTEVQEDIEAIKSAIEIIENNNPRFTDLESLESAFITALEVTLEEMKLAQELAIEQLKRNAED